MLRDRRDSIKNRLDFGNVLDLGMGLEITCNSSNICNEYNKTTSLTLLNITTEIQTASVELE